MERTSTAKSPANSRRRSLIQPRRCSKNRVPIRGVDKYSVHTYPVLMPNLTLSIPDELLRRGRSYAQARGKSLNALVRELLNETTSSPDSSVDSRIERLSQSAGDSKGVKIAREELHRY